ncbi:hypothetical protein ABZP36_008480 [Zizania latifolia]
MAFSPEEDLDPFSPSLFLDLPPTPHDNDDLVLPFISRMLMEDDVDDKFFYQYPDHPALLTAQQPYARVLDRSSSDDTTTSCFATSSSANATWPYDPIELSQLLQSPPHPDTLALPEDDVIANGDGGATQGVRKEDTGQQLFAGNDMDMMNMAFLKGREEANKFLPTSNTLFARLEANEFLTGARLKVDPVEDGTFLYGESGSGRGRKNLHAEDNLEAEMGRSSKLMMPEHEETAATREMFDEIMLRGYEVLIKGVEELRVAMGSEAEKKARNGNGAGRKAARAKEVVDLRTLLIHCAQAVAMGDRRSASELLQQIRQHSSASGDATQRLAHCFAEGLEARLAGTGSQVYQSLMAKRTSMVDFLKAYKLFTAACCFQKINFIFSNQNIYGAVAGRRKLHIVDYGLHYGFQWPGLLKLLATREGGPPEVTMTGIDLPQPGFRPAHQIEETGRRLSSCARELGVPFKFRGVAAKWETVRGEDLNIDPEEVLVVNSMGGFDNLMDESVVVDSRSPRDVVLSSIRDMKPDLFIHCVVNGTYGSPFFVTRFREALFFYSAKLDMLDATIPRDNDERLLIERDILGRCALNVIACEGPDRVARPETYKQWQLRSHRAGLMQLPLNPQLVEHVRDKVSSLYHKDFVVDVDHRWLLQGWKGRVLYAMSTWVAADHKSLF